MDKFDRIVHLLHFSGALNCTGQDCLCPPAMGVVEVTGASGGVLRRVARLALAVARVLPPEKNLQT